MGQQKSNIPVSRILAAIPIISLTDAFTPTSRNVQVMKLRFRLFSTFTGKPSSYYDNNLNIFFLLQWCSKKECWTSTNTTSLFVYFYM